MYAYKVTFYDEKLGTIMVIADDMIEAIKTVEYWMEEAVIYSIECIREYNERILLQTSYLNERMKHNEDTKEF